MNLLDRTVDILFWLAVIWLLAKVVEIYLVAKNRALIADIEEMTEQIKNSIIRVDIEKHGDVFYLYEKDTREFIAQGSNFEEIVQQCTIRFKGKSVMGDQKQMTELGLK